MSGQPEDIPAPLIDWCVSVLGADSFIPAAEVSWPHGESRVWRLQLAGGTHVYLKAQRQIGKWHTEVHAYESGWAEAFGSRAPRLIAAREEPYAILLTELPGVIMDGKTLTGAKDHAVWAAAGAALARMHSLATNDWFGSPRRDGTPQGTPQTDPAMLLSAGIENFVERGRRAGCVDEDEIDFTRAKLAEWVPSMQGEVAIPIHRDYSPRNWMVDSITGEWMGVIDFEHARWDVRAADLNRWWDREFLDRPDRAEAFFDAYSGGPPDERLAAQIRLMRLRGAFTGIVWSVEHNDAAFADLNRDALRRLREEAKDGI